MDIREFFPFFRAAVISASLLATVSLLYSALVHLRAAAGEGDNRVPESLLGFLALTALFSFPLISFNGISVHWGFAGLVLFSLFASFPHVLVAAAGLLLLRLVSGAGPGRLLEMLFIACIPLLTAGLRRILRFRGFSRWQRIFQLHLYTLGIHLLLAIGYFAERPGFSLGSYVLWILLWVLPLTTLCIWLFARPVISSELVHKLEVSQARFMHLFEYAPVALWDEDYSQAVQYVWGFGESGSEQLVTSLRSNISEYFSRIQIRNMNQRALELLGAGSKAELLERIGETFTEDSPDSFIAELEAIQARATSSVSSSHIRSLSGEDRFVRIHWNVLPGNEEDYKSVIVAVTDTTELVKQTRLIQESVRSKEMLIREIHHRVRNSLAIAHGILGIQKQHIEDASIRRTINQTQNRIQTIAQLHTRLYQDGAMLTISARKYFEDLTRMLKDQVPALRKLELKVSSALFHVDQVLPLGLICCELMAGCEDVEAEAGQDTDLHGAAAGLSPLDLFIALGIQGDEGVFEYREVYTSSSGELTRNRCGELGEIVIDALCTQIHGNAVTEARSDGREFRIRFPLEETLSGTA